MNEREKAAAGLLYDANNNAELIHQRLEAKVKVHEYNHLDPRDLEGKERILKHCWAKRASTSSSRHLSTVTTVTTLSWAKTSTPM
ncbi:maltose acetyltransferase domain-containing protein [Pseudomonas asuensis]